MYWDPISRRNFVRTASGALFTLPFLPSLIPKLARAASVPVRTVFLMYAHGGLDAGNPLGALRPYNLSNRRQFTPVGSSIQASRYDISPNPNGALAPALDSKFKQSQRSFSYSDWA